MCGRYRLTAKERYLRDHFGLDDDPSWTPRWNIAPTQEVATIRQHRSEPKRIFGLIRWRLIPYCYWAQEPPIGHKTVKGDVGKRRRSLHRSNRTRSRSRWFDVDGNVPPFSLAEAQYAQYRAREMTENDR